LANKRIDPVLRKKIFVLLTSAELDPFMQINHFSDEDQGWIKEAKDKFSKASIIFYFLNEKYGRFSLDSFLPIYNTQTEFNNAPDNKKIGTALCIDPLMLELAVKSWRREKYVEYVKDWVFDNPNNWQGDYGFGLQEDGNMAAEMDISPDAGVPVTQGYIDFMKTQLNAYLIKASLRPEFMSYVNKIAGKIEEMQRKLDSASNSKTTTEMSETIVSVSPEQDESTTRRTMLQHQKLQEALTELEKISKTHLIELEKISRTHRKQLETISGLFRIQRMLAYSEMDPAFLDMENVAAWPSITQSEELSGYIKVPRLFFEKKKVKPKGYCYVVCVKGESMTGKIPDDSVVLIRKADVPKNGIIRVLSCKGKPPLKRVLEHKSHSWTMRIEDGSGKHIDLSDEDYQVQRNFVAVLPEYGK